MNNRMKISGLLLCALWLPLIAGAQTYTKTETIEYHDDTALWVLGQVKRTTTNGIETFRTDYGWKALPWKTYSFGKLQRTLAYDTTSTVASGQLATLNTVADGNNNITTLSSWKRGIPQKIKYPAAPEYPTGAEQTAEVNDAGWITWVEDENRDGGTNGYRTCYAYDAMGRMSQITYPSEATAGVCDTSTWAARYFDFHPLGASDWRPADIATGQWVRRTWQGNYRNIAYMDAMWRPVLNNEYDESNQTSTLRTTGFAYDSSGRRSFSAYPTTAGTAGTTGTRTYYDALDRVIRVEQDSELGILASTTEYQTGFKTLSTNPRGQQTLAVYRAYDIPTYDQPHGISELGGDRHTEIYRDVFGKPYQVRRRNGTGSESAWRYYVYDNYQQLCKTIEPETGATVMEYDGNGNLGWSVSGLQGYGDTANCNRDAAWNTGLRVHRSYDARNRLTNLNFPDGRGDQVWSYTPDGLPATITTYNRPSNAGPVINAYAYNKRRMLAGESVQQPSWYGWGIGYGYDANGSLFTQTYPTGLVVNYAPNALGQATQAGSYATGVQYHPNGAIKQFMYGNGIVHTMVQNARQLPQHSTDSGGTLDLAYSFDANANVNHIWDYAQDSGNGFYGRWMTYDGLDRLTDAGSCSFGGDCWHRFTYDALDNLKSWKLPGVKDYAEYVYDAKNQLTNIKDSAGATVVGLGYDVQGNLANKNGFLYQFDYGNRLRSNSLEQGFTYDGHSRRASVTRGSMNPRFRKFAYAVNGQLLYEENTANSSLSEHVYLGGSLIATRSSISTIPNGQPTVTYTHTDALGSPVAKTDQAGVVQDRTSYEPYGTAINKPTYEGIGYTGHVMDGATGLTYMQQRYYDPGIGRFLSVDPITADGNTGSNFNRYWYANNNPYAFTDPDGRESCALGQEMVCRFGVQNNSDSKASQSGSSGGKGPDPGGIKTLDTVVVKPNAADYYGPGAVFTSQDDAYSAANSFVTELNGGPVRNFLFGQSYFKSVTQINSSPNLFTYSLIPINTGTPPGVMIRVAPAGLITGYTRHGLNQAISRDGGRGVSALSILNAVRNPAATVAGRGGTMVYTGADGTTVVLNQAGKVITTYGVPRAP